MLTSEQIKRLQSKVGSPTNQNLTVQEKNAQYLANMRQSLKTKSDLNEYKKTEEGKSFLDKVGEFGSQAGRQIWKTVDVIGGIGQKTLGRMVGAYDKEKGVSHLPEELIREAETPSEKKGAFFGEAIQYLTPAGAEKATLKGVTFLEKALANYPKFSSLFKTGLKSVVGGAEFGGKTALMGGDKEEVETAGKIGLITPPALKTAGVVNKPVTNVIKRLFTGLGAGLSGVSTQALELIAKNPKISQEFSNIIKKEGVDSVLEKNAKTILEGVSKIRKQARGAYGDALKKLKAEDVSKTKFRKSIQPFLDKIVTKEAGKKVFRGISGDLETGKFTKIFEPSQKGALKEFGFSVSTDKKIAKQFGDKVLEGTILPNAKIKKVGKVMEDLDSVLAKAKKEGFDGVEFSSYDRTFDDFFTEITIFNPKVIKTKQQLADTLGTLKNVEFENPSLIKKASNLIDDISRTKLDGLSLRNIINKIEKTKFKTTGGDAERLSFNAFLKDLGSTIKKAVNDSTDKLGEMNKKFSTDMSLAEGMEDIFRKVKFKNTKELNQVARKLEGLFSKKGLDPKTIDNFLKRIGVSAEEFKTSQAVANIATKTTGANTRGLTITEVLQQITSSVVTPDMVKNIAVATGIAQNIIKTIVDNTPPSARALIIKSLLDNKE